MRYIRKADFSDFIVLSLWLISFLDISSSQWSYGKIITEVDICTPNFYFFKNSNPDTVAHICNPSYAGGIGRRIVIQASSGQKCEALSKNN
jgi:hypothetical protein